MSEALARALAAKFLEYSELIAKGQDEPEAMTSARTIAGDSLDAAFENMHLLACQILGKDAAAEMRRIQELGWGS